MQQGAADPAGHASPNAEQAEYWNASPAAESWASLQQDIDRQFAPLSAKVLEALAPMPGERILDVGCGSGDTSLAIARRVGASGAVTGLDISGTLLAVARRRAAEQGVAAEFIEADAQSYAFAGAAYDALFSRFGVMFFADPVAAFRNLRGALKPGGRLAFVCWRPAKENPMFSGPYKAAADLFTPPSEPVDPHAPGPFAFADDQRLRGILTEAGFGDVGIDPFDQKIGGNSPEEALNLALHVGPLARMLREQPHARQQAIERVRTLLAGLDGPDGVLYDSATWIVTARTA